MTESTDIDTDHQIMEEMHAEIEALKNAVMAASAGQVPEGFVLMPREMWSDLYTFWQVQTKGGSILVNEHVGGYRMFDEMYAMAVKAADLAARGR